MKLIGLTGSIGMGKSTTAALFRRRFIPVYDADLAVHRLSAEGGKAVPAIAAAFPDLVTAGRVDRAGLGARVFADRGALRCLEAILHPLVRAERERFLRRARRERRRLVVLDVPLLFETGGDRTVDYVAVVSCPAFLQSARALKRPGMTAEKLARIRASQMPDWQKRKKADRVIATGLGKRSVIRQIDLIRRALLERTE